MAMNKKMKKKVVSKAAAYKVGEGMEPKSMKAKEIKMGMKKISKIK